MRARPRASFWKIRCLRVPIGAMSLMGISLSIVSRRWGEVLILGRGRLSWLRNGRTSGISAPFSTITGGKIQPEQLNDDKYMITN